MLRILAAALLAALPPAGALAGEPDASTTPAEAHPPAAADARPVAATVRDAAPGAAPLAEGRVESQGADVELLARRVRAGDTIELPEGYLRVEEDGVEDGEVGSFSIVPARTLRPESVARADSAEAVPTALPPSPAEAGAAAPAERPCRRERAAYLRELWKESGIEVEDPDAVIEGLEAGGGPASGFYWFALATDPFRPLAWSSSLRSRADALARCVRQR